MANTEIHKGFMIQINEVQTNARITKVRHKNLTLHGMSTIGMTDT